MSYEITVKHSKMSIWLQRLLPYIIAIFALLLLTDTSLLLSSMLFFTILTILLSYQQYVKSKNRTIPTPSHFTLNAHNGTVIYSGCVEQTVVGKSQLLPLPLPLPLPLILSVQSRVSLLGCWLYFELQPQGQINLGQPWFIFRDSLSVQDFSRLTRVINSLSFIKHKSKTIQAE